MFDNSNNNNGQSNDSNSLNIERFYSDMIIDALPSNRAIQMGAVVLTGGYDKLGRPLIVFPASKHQMIHSNDISRDEMSQALDYYYRIIRVPDKSAGSSILIDLRVSTDMLVNCIFGAISLHRKHFINAVGMIYVVRPQTRSAANLVKDKLCIKKPNFFEKMFKMTPAPIISDIKGEMVKTLQDLIVFIDKKYLTQDFGGYLQFSQVCWLRLKQNLDAYIKDVTDFKNQFYEISERIQKLEEFLTSTHLSEDCQQIIYLKYLDIIHESGIEDLFHTTDNLLNNLVPNDGIGSKVTAAASVYSELTNNPHLSNAQYLVTIIRGKLIEIHNHFQIKYKTIEDKIEIVPDPILSERVSIEEQLEKSLSEQIIIEAPKKELHEFKNDSYLWIQTVGLPMVNTTIKFEDNIDDSELSAQQFHNRIFVPGIQHYDKCKEVFDQLEFDRACYSTSSQIYISNIQATLEQFHDKLQSRRQLLSDFYQFNLNINRIKSWIRRFLHFMPDHLVHYHSQLNPMEIMPLGSAWIGHLRQFLQRHPCPSRDHVDLIDRTTGFITNFNIRKNTRLILYKLRLLVKICNKSEITVKEVREIISWKERMQVDLRIKEFSEEIKSQEKQSKYIQNGENSNNYKGTQSNLKQLKDANLTKSQPMLVQKDDIFDEAQFIRNNSRKKYLIKEAEDTVRESLRDINLIRERDFRKSDYLKSDDDELTEILDNLLKDISSPTSNQSYYSPSTKFN